ncbi:MAG: hypothetical protein CM1200mP29_00440 [Verrucomicrobiota bacterium]|nr:MAG: hypothetical protein CM1200mP29_00440 [Verrucomicrobiota bacterium]
MTRAWSTSARCFRRISRAQFDERLALGLVKRLQPTNATTLSSLSCRQPLDRPYRPLPGSGRRRSLPGARLRRTRVSGRHSLRPIPQPRSRPEQAAEAVEQILRNDSPGDILIFMPGMGEIRGTMNAKQSAGAARAGRADPATWRPSAGRSGPRLCQKRPPQSRRRHQRRRDLDNHRRHPPLYRLRPGPRCPLRRRARLRHAID